MQRSECRTPSWLGGYAERRSISMMERQNAKEWVQNTKLAWGLCRATQHFDDGTSKSPNPLRDERQRRNRNLRKSVVSALSACHWTLITHCQHKKSLHPSRRMAWKILRHGVAVNFLSPRKKTQQSLRNKHVPINFYKISKNNSVFILLLQNKGVSLQCCSG